MKCKKKNIIIGILILIIAFAFLVILCGGFYFLKTKKIEIKPKAEKSEVQAISFYHWWTSPGEEKALEALINVFAERYPGVAVLPTSVTGKSAGGGSFELFNVVQPMIVAGEAPDAFQMNAGYSAQRYVDGDYLEPVDEIWKAEKLEEVTHLSVQELCKLGDHYYGIPLNIHRTNVIWYNKSLLDENGITPEALTSWERFFEAAEKLKKGGIKYPISMGQIWTAGQVFEGIVASGGIEFYEDWINGKVTDSNDPRLKKAFDVFKEYISYINPDYKNTTWNSATESVIKKESAFNIMGDWNNGEFKTAGMIYGKDYGYFPLPGTENLYGMGVDTFQRPKGSIHPKSAEKWLKVVSSKEGQDAFNPLKGSISVRLDSDTEKYDEYQQDAIRDFWNATYMYPTLSNGAPVLFVDRIQNILENFIETGDGEDASEKMTNFSKEFNDIFIKEWILY